MKKLKITLTFGLCLSLLPVTNAISAEQETYFTCKNGFQFETKKKAARCIKQERLIYQAPQACSKHNNKQSRYKLVLDKKGVKDMCMPQVSGKATPRALKCPTGFSLQVRKGKDACAKGNPQLIKPVDKKTKR